MARDFSGTNEHLDGGSDASIDAFTTISVAFWLQRDVLNATYFLVGKDRATAAWAFFAGNNAQSNQMYLDRQWSGALAEWNGTGAIDTGLHHLAFTYDGGATTNDPVFYLDGVAITVNEATAPSGTLNSDAAATLRLGESGAATADLNGGLQNVTMVNGILTAAQINRHRWWGRVGGAVEVHHPLLTTKLTNEGTATADMTATGTTMRSLPRVMRPGCGGW